MAIGTTLKIGFDATAVKAGFGALRGMFNASFRGMRQIAIGGAREVGVRTADLLGRALMAVPEGITETMDWAGNLTDMSEQTGVAISKLVLMEEALRLAGASAADTSRMLSTLGANIFEATKDTGPARDAFHKLGLRMGDIKSATLDQVFEKIGRSVATSQFEMGELENVMADLFGARMGYKMIRFFRDFDGGMAQAENNVGDFARRLDATAPGMDKMSDALGRAKMRWRELMAVGIDALTRMFGDDWVDQMFDKLSPEKLRNTFTFLREAIMGFLKDGMQNLLREAGRMIAEGLKESMGNALNPMKAMKNFFTPNAPQASRSTESTKLIAIAERQASLLQGILNKRTGYA